MWIFDNIRSSRFWVLFDTIQAHERIKLVFFMSNFQTKFHYRFTHRFCHHSILPNSSIVALLWLEDYCAREDLLRARVHCSRSVPDARCGLLRCPSIGFPASRKVSNVATFIYIFRWWDSDHLYSICLSLCPLSNVLLND